MATALDPGSLARLRHRWPDSAPALSDAIPAQAFVVRTEDAWFAAKHSEGSWLRTVDLARASSGPTRDELGRAAQERARQLGFKAIAHDQDADREVWRRIDKGAHKAAPHYLRIGPAILELPATTIPVLQIDFETGCPWHDMQARVETSSVMAFSLQSLGLKGAPILIRLETLYDPADLSEIIAIREAIRFKQRRAVTSSLANQGFAPTADDPRQLCKQESSSKGRLSITVSAQSGEITAELILDRSNRVGTPAR